MPNNTLNDLSQLSGMNANKLKAIFHTMDLTTLAKNKAMPLCEIIPSPIWQMLNQGQKGYVGTIFYQEHKKLGFEYVGKGKYGTTNFYRLVVDIN